MTEMTLLIGKADECQQKAKRLLGDSYDLAIKAAKVALEKIAAENGTDTFSAAADMAKTCPEHELGVMLIMAAAADIEQSSLSEDGAGHRDAAPTYPPEWTMIAAVFGMLVTIISFGFAWWYSSAGATIVMSVGSAIAAAGFGGAALARRR